MSGVSNYGSQVGTREVKVGLHESSYVAERGVGATLVIRGPCVELLVIR